MDFLASSATFLGVILTLNVLCLFAEKDSNFILRFLLEQRVRLKEALEKKKSAVDTRIKNFEEGQEFKRIDCLANDAAESESLDIYTTANEISYKYTLKTKGLKTDLSSCYSIMDRVMSSNEQIRAPFFTLMFGLLIFSLNEISQWFDSEAAALIMPGIWIFCLLSIIYWLTIWISFLSRSMKEGDVTLSSGFWGKVDEKLGVLIGGGIKILICASISALVLVIVDVDVMHEFWSFAIVLGSVLLLITLIGLWRLIMCGVKGKYSALHTLGHLLAFVVYSCCLGVIYNIFGEGKCDCLFQNAQALDNTIIFFSLLNGIVFPFMLPYIKYRSPYKSAMNDLDESVKSLGTAIDTFEKEYDKLARAFFNKNFTAKKGCKK